MIKGSRMTRRQTSRYIFSSQKDPKLRSVGIALAVNESEHDQMAQSFAAQNQINGQLMQNIMDVDQKVIQTQNYIKQQESRIVLPGG